MGAVVLTVSRSGAHSFSKANAQEIRLVPGLGGLFIHDLPSPVARLHPGPGRRREQLPRKDDPHLDELLGRPSNERTRQFLQRVTEAGRM